MANNLLLQIPLFAASLFFLMKGADWLIDGASTLARRFRIPELIIGLTLVALGTSLPELVVSVIASINDQPELAWANVIGSNITNILLVIGITCILQPLRAPANLITKDAPFSLILVLSFGAWLLWCALSPGSGLPPGAVATYDRVGGIGLLTFFLLFVIRLFLTERSENTEENDDPGKTWQLFLLLVGGTIALGFGGQYTVASAINIARIMGVSETTIGLTIVAFGTSLPELVASLVAARKGSADIALGNIVGSNIMNLTLVLGFTSTFSPVYLETYDLVDGAVMIVVSVVFFSLMFRKVDRHFRSMTGLVFFISWVLYMFWIALRATEGGQV